MGSHQGEGPEFLHPQYPTAVMGQIWTPVPGGGGPKLLNRLLQHAQRVVRQIVTPYLQGRTQLDKDWLKNTTFSFNCLRMMWPGNKVNVTDSGMMGNLSNMQSLKENFNVKVCATVGWPNTDHYIHIISFIFQVLKKFKNWTERKMLSSPQFSNNLKNFTLSAPYLPFWCPRKKELRPHSINIMQKINQTERSW